MASQFAIEVWAKYGTAIAIMTLRFAVRFKAVGWRNFDGTDLWCLVATSFYTIVSTCDYILSTPNYPTIIGLNPTTAMEVPDEQIPLYARGSKIAHFSWTMYICMIFSFKGVMLSLFHKVGMDIWRQERLVLCTTILVVCSWIVSVLTHICVCLPVSRVGQVKPWPGPNCTTRPLNYYVAGVLNMITDTLILMIPMPILWKLRIPIRRKVALVVMFSSGIFIIICTILRTYYSLGVISQQETAQAWAGREGFVSMVVVSAPGIWPLVRNTRFFKPEYEREPYDPPSDSRDPNSQQSSQRKKPFRRWMGLSLLETENVDHDGYKMTSRSVSKGGDVFNDAGSQEHIISGDGAGVEASSSQDADGVMPITVTTEFSVKREHDGTGKEASDLTMDRVRRSDW